jgi:uncharacterized membrane protein
MCSERVDSLVICAQKGEGEFLRVQWSVYSVSHLFDGLATFVESIIGGFAGFDISTSLQLSEFSIVGDHHLEGVSGLVLVVAVVIVTVLQYYY